jgi:hypothetical protein
VGFIERARWKRDWPAHFFLIMARTTSMAWPWTQPATWS